MMDMYTTPYIGMHFVSMKSVPGFGKSAFELARVMPDVERQSKAIRVAWTGYGPISREPPVEHASLRITPCTDFMSAKYRSIDRSDFQAMGDWARSESTGSVEITRELPRQEHDPFKHSAWLVAGESPMIDVGDTPQTEMCAITVASPIVEQSIGDQRAWVERVLDAIGVCETGWEYGYIEVGDWGDILTGDVYSTHMGDAVRWRRMLEYNVWQAYGMLPANYKHWQERYPVKGVYWGNYFGPAVLDRIGGAQRIKAHIDERCLEDPRNGWYRDMPGGALFLALSDRISDAQYTRGSPPHRAMNSAVWLWSILREANVMI